MSIKEKIDLVFTDPSINSDKEYHAQIEEIPESGGGDPLYLVTFQYGRRGSTLQGGAKTPDPVSYDKAKKIYARLVAEKTGKGYIVMGGVVTPYVTAAPAPKQASKMEPVGAARRILWDNPDLNPGPAGIDTSMLAQLPNAIDEDEVEGYLRDDAWGMQEKKDGEHQVVRKCSGVGEGCEQEG